MYAENSRCCRPKSKCLTTTAIMLDGMEKKNILFRQSSCQTHSHTHFFPPRSLFFRPMFGKPSCLLVSSYYFSCARCDDYYYYKYKHVPFQRCAFHYYKRVVHDMCVCSARMPAIMKHMLMYEPEDYNYKRFWLRSCEKVRWFIYSKTEVYCSCRT